MKIEVFDNMAQVSEEEVRLMLPQVSRQRREQALKYKHTPGQYCCLKSAVMLKQAGVTGEWQYNEYGKPYVANGPCFSISHCKKGIAVAVSDRPIGIDIEAIREADEGLIERVMNEAEQALIHASEAPDRAFTRLWTRKEAVLKAKGTGIVSFEQLKEALSGEPSAFSIETIEKEKYIYSIAYE